MQNEWVYDRDTEVMTSKDAIGRHRLVALKMQPPDAEAILDLVGLALFAATTIHVDAKRPCGCLGCRARRVIETIDGGGP